MQLNLKQTRLREDFSRVWEQPAVLRTADPSFLPPGVKKGGWLGNNWLRSGLQGGEGRAGRSQGRRLLHFGAGSVKGRAQRREASGIPGGRAGPSSSLSQNQPYLGRATHNGWLGSAQLSGVKPATPPNPPSTPPTDEGRTTCTCSSSCSSTAIAPRFFCHWLRPLLPLQSRRPSLPAPPSPPLPAASFPPPKMLVDGGLAGGGSSVPGAAAGRSSGATSTGAPTSQEEEKKQPAKQTAILTQPRVGGVGAKPGRAGPGQAGSGQAGGASLLGGATQTAHCLPSRETNSVFQTQQGSQRVSSIHLHRRNRSFPSNEQFIENRSHLVPTSTRRYVNSFARGHYGRVFFSPSPLDINVYIDLNFLSFFLSLSPPISNRSHHRCRRDTQLKSGLVSSEDSRRPGSPPSPLARHFSALLRSPTWKRVWW